MKNKYALLLFLIPLCLLSQNNLQSLFDDLDKSTMQSDILLNQFLSSSGLIDDTKDTFNTNSYFQAYNELRAGDTQQRFKEFEILRKAQKQSYLDNIIPIGLLLGHFDILNERALTDGSVILNSNKKLQISQTAIVPIYKSKTKLVAAPFRKDYKGQSVTYSISREFFLNISKSEIKTIQIDFDNNEGYKNVTIGDRIQINYSNAGNKILQFKVSLINKNVYQSYSNIEIIISPQTSQTRSISPGINTITASNIADLSAYGEANSYAGEGEYQLFLDTVDGILDKPIIIVDGFDPGNLRDIPGIYDILDYTDSMGTSNLADFVRSQGFDVIMLNAPVYTNSGSDLIDGGSDFLERNAMVLVELINLINSCKVGSEQNVIIGPSMGGLISRYALAWMEKNTIDHDTRLWLSFDAPHHGANVPLGLQHLLNYMAFGLDGNNVVTLQDLVNGMLKSAAARQMLTDHLEAHLLNDFDFDNTSTEIFPKAHPWKAIFDSDLNSLTTSGFPEITRNVSIINGSGDNARYEDVNTNPINPGFSVIDATLDVAFLTTAELEVNMTPSTANSGTGQLISSVDIKFAGFSIIGGPQTATAKAFWYTDGIDAGSGGLFDMSSLSEGIDTSGLVGDFLNALQTDVFNFIPSVSAMAMEITNDEIDWYHDLDLGEGESPTFAVIDNSPFVNWYIPTVNEPHVELTEENVTFAISEIVLETLGNIEFEQLKLRLKQNPVDTEFVLLSNSTLQNVKLSIFDITGKEMYSDIKTLSGRTVIPVNLSSGLYILNLTTEENYNKRIKLVIN